MTDRYIVWSKMQAEAGEPLAAIIARKEVERLAGDGVFFWGMGSALGRAVSEIVRPDGPTLEFTSHPTAKRRIGSAET
jgi:hypothetical protein